MNTGNTAQPGADAALLDTKMNLPTLPRLLRDLEEWRQDQSQPLHLLCYDIDSLRKINFSYGHAVGDELLRQVAAWIQQQVVFNRESDEIMQDYIRLQLDLKTCILRDMAGFSLVFQPIADPATGLWAGLEALSRWRRGDGSLIPPLIFIPEVEKLGLMRPFGLWVLEQAVDTCKSMGLDSLERFFLSVNVSASQMAPEFAGQVKSVLARHGYPPQKLNLEITESAEFIFSNTTHALLEDLRALGVTFALDDFGTGYSSLSNMKHLPVRYIKTEREFIYGIENDNYLQYSLYVISESAHASGMQLIVEGVETRDTLRCVAKNGADFVQGYFYSQPMDRDTLHAHRDCFTQPSTCAERQSQAERFNFARWLRSKDAYNIAPGLFELLDQCLNKLLNEDDLDRALNDVLGMTGAYCRVNRAFVFLRDEGAAFSNRYEWCAPGVAPQKHLFQQVDADRDGFFQALCQEPFLVASQEYQLPDNMRQRLAGGGQTASIQALAVQAMHRQGQVLGFVGFDDDQPRDWLPEEMLLLHNLCLLVLIKLNMWGTDEPSNE